MLIVIYVENSESDELSTILDVAEFCELFVEIKIEDELSYSGEIYPRRFLNLLNAFDLEDFKCNKKSRDSLSILHMSIAELKIMAIRAIKQENKICWKEQEKINVEIYIEGVTTFEDVVVLSWDDYTDLWNKLGIYTTRYGKVNPNEFLGYLVAEKEKSIYFNKGLDDVLFLNEERRIPIRSLLTMSERAVREENNICWKII